jgi:hypothetical protein
MCATSRARHGPTTIWALEDEVAREINARHTNSLYLQGFELTPALRATRRVEEAHPVEPERLHEVIDLPRGHPMDVRFLDHAEERTLRTPARLQQRREVAPRLHFGIANSIVPTRVSHVRSR